MGDHYERLGEIKKLKVSKQTVSNYLSERINIIVFVMDLEAEEKRWRNSQEFNCLFFHSHRLQSFQILATKQVWWLTLTTAASTRSPISQEIPEVS